MNFTVTIPDDRVDDLAAALKTGVPPNVPWLGPVPYPDTDDTDADVIDAWLIGHVRSMLWDWDRQVAADATTDPLA